MEHKIIIILIVRKLHVNMIKNIYIYIDIKNIHYRTLRKHA